MCLVLARTATQLNEWCIITSACMPDCRCRATMLAVLHQTTQMLTSYLRLLNGTELMPADDGVRVDGPMEGHRAECSHDTAVQLDDSPQQLAVH